MPDAATVLRARASRLEAAARSLHDSPAQHLHRRADEHTWRGPTALRCHAELVALRAHLAVAVAELESAARSLRRRAAAIEVAR